MLASQCADATHAVKTCPSAYSQICRVCGFVGGGAAPALPLGGGTTLVGYPSGEQPKHSVFLILNVLIYFKGINTFMRHMKGKQFINLANCEYKSHKQIKYGFMLLMCLGKEYFT